VDFEVISYSPLAARDVSALDRFAALLGCFEFALSGMHHLMREKTKAATRFIVRQ
jgi:hypothetical protein